MDPEELSPYLTVGQLADLCDGWPADRPVWIATAAGTVGPQRVTVAGHLDFEIPDALVLRGVAPWAEDEPIAELAMVALNRAVPTAGLSAGAVGWVVHAGVYADGEGFEVEFPGSVVETLIRADIRPVTLTWLVEWGTPSGVPVPATSLHLSEAGARARIAAVAAERGLDDPGPGSVSGAGIYETVGVGDVVAIVRRLGLSA